MSKSNRGRLALAAVSAGAATGVGVMVPATASAAGNTLTVDGSNASCGTAAGSAVYCTIAAGVKNAAAGDTVVVNPGSYAGGASVKVSGLTIKANGAVTINSGAHAFTVVGVSDVTIQGFTVTNTSGTGFDLGDRSATASAASHKITNNLRILDNTVTGSGGASAGPGVTGTATAQGISAYYVTGSTFSGNHLDHNNDHGLLLAAGSNGNAVSGNEASGNWTPAKRRANGINVTGATNNMVTGNVLHNNQDSGLQFYTGSDQNKAINNVSYRNGDHGIDNLDAVGGEIVNNTVFDNCDAGINVEGKSTGYTVKNNIAVDNGTDTSCAHGPAGVGQNTDPNDHPGQPGQIRLADFAINATTEGSNLVHSVNSVLVPPTNFQALNTNDLNVDPGFASAAGNDFSIGPASPAVGKADPTAPDLPTKDINGKGRPVPGSIGAFEGGVAPQTPVASATYAGPTGYAPSAVVSVDASGSTAGNVSPTLSYLIDFGDSANSTAANPNQVATVTGQHTYTVAATYTISITVTDGANNKSTTTHTVTVTAVPPTAAFTLTPSAGTAPVTVTADASASSAFGGRTIADYTFNFGDGTIVGPQASAIATHAYAYGNPSTQVTVTVHDSAKISGTATTTIAIGGAQAPPPSGGGPGGGGGTNPPAGSGSATVVQIGGADRYSTGVLVSQHRWQAGQADAVVIATGANFADALSGVPLAAKAHGPLLLVDGAAKTANPAVVAEINRVLKPGGKVYILGGTAAVSAGIESQLSGGHAVTRFAGANRYQTSVDIANRGLGSPAHTVVATGNGFADALASGPYATGPFADGAGAPAAILLSNDKALDPQVAGYLAGKSSSNITAIGHQAAAAVPSAAVQFAGADRFATDQLVAGAFGGSPAKVQVGVADGMNFPDALTGGAYMAGLASPGPIVLVDGGPAKNVPAGAQGILNGHAGAAEVDLFGGPAVIIDRMAQQIALALGVTLVTHVGF